MVISSMGNLKNPCPGCGAIIRATKEVRVMCADCELEFEEEI
jgi:ribosomal protein S27AE